MPEGTHLRVARPTGQPDRLATMYREGLGFEELGSFRDHDGFDGSIAVVDGQDWR